jgi:hypothetical protein
MGRNVASKRSTRYALIAALLLFTASSFLAPVQISQNETTGAIHLSTTVAQAADWVQCQLLDNAGWVQETQAQCSAGGGSVLRTATCDVSPDTSAGSSCTQTSVSAAAKAYDNVGQQCNSLVTCVADLVYVVTVGPTAIFAYIGSLFLSVGIKLSLTSTAYALSFLTTGWSVARDVSNIVFLFALIFLAITIILRANSAGTTSTLALIVVMALLVNFSFFLTRVVIDAGNVVAVQVYNAIPINTRLIDTINNSPAAATAATQGSGGGSALCAGNFICDPSTKDLTSSIMGTLNLQTLYSNPAFTDWAKRTNGLEQLLTLVTLYIATAILLAVLGFVFLSVGAKFLLRIVALWLIIISAPMAFAAYALPQTKHFFTRWRQELLKNTFYPAVFLFLFLILVVFMQQGCPTGSTTQCLGILSNVFSATGGTVPDQSWAGKLGVAMASVAIVMGLIILLLYIAMRVADRVSVSGASITAKFPGFVAGRYAGALSFAGRQTLGRFGQVLSRDESLQGAAAKGGVGGMAARTLLRGGNLAATGSYDARGSRSMGGTLRQVGAGGPTGQGGRRADVEARARRQEQTADMLKTNEAAKARRSNDATAKGFLNDQQAALGERLKAENDYRELTRQYLAETDAVKKNEIDVKRRGVQNTISGFRTDEESAKQKREMYINDTQSERERLGQFAETISTPGISNIGIPSEGSTIAASRIRGKLPVMPARFSEEPGMIDAGAIRALESQEKDTGDNLNLKQLDIDQKLAAVKAAQDAPASSPAEQAIKDATVQQLQQVHDTAVHEHEDLKKVADEITSAKTELSAMKELMGKTGSVPQSRMDQFLITHAATIQKAVEGGQNRTTGNLSEAQMSLLANEHITAGRTAQDDLALMEIKKKIDDYNSTARDLSRVHTVMTNTPQQIFAPLQNAQNNAQRQITYNPGQPLNAMGRIGGVLRSAVRRGPPPTPPPGAGPRATP